MRKSNLLAVICSAVYVISAFLLLMIDLSASLKQGQYSWEYYVTLVPVGVLFFFIFKKAFQSPSKVKSLFIAGTLALSIIMEYVAVVHCIHGYYSWVGPVVIMCCGLVFVFVVLLVPKSVFDKLEKH